MRSCYFCWNYFSSFLSRGQSKQDGFTCLRCTHHNLRLILIQGIPYASIHSGFINVLSQESCYSKTVLALHFKISDKESRHREVSWFAWVHMIRLQLRQNLNLFCELSLWEEVEIIKISVPSKISVFLLLCVVPSPMCHP